MSATELDILASYLDDCSKYNVLFNESEKKKLLDSDIRISYNGFYNIVESKKRSLCLETLFDKLDEELYNKFLKVCGPLFFFKVTNKKIQSHVGMFYLESRDYVFPNIGDFINRRIFRSINEMIDIDAWNNYYNASDTVVQVTIDTLYRLSKIIGVYIYDQDYKLDKFNRAVNEITHYSLSPDLFYNQFNKLFKLKTKILLMHLDEVDNKSLKEYIKESDLKMMDLYKRYSEKLYNRWSDFTNKYYGIANNDNKNQKQAVNNKSWFNSISSVASMTVDTLYNFSMLLEIPGYDLKNFIRTVDRINIETITTPDEFLSIMNKFNESKGKMILNQIEEDDPSLKSFKKLMMSIDDQINRLYEKYICEIHDKIVKLNTSPSQVIYSV